MKKVYICKVFDDGRNESRIRALISRSKKRFGPNIRVLFTDENIKEKFSGIGIPGKIFQSLFDNYAADEPVWEKVYQLSDELHVSAENNKKLKYSGINFLTLEDIITIYLFKVKFTSLCSDMIQQNYETLFIILSPPFSLHFPDINTKNIHTVKYQNNSFTHLPVLAPVKAVNREIYPMIHIFLHQISLLLKTIINKVSGTNIKRGEKENPQYRLIDNKQLRALFVVTGMLHVPTMLAIHDSCIKNGIEPHIVTADGSILPTIQSLRIAHSYRDTSFPLIKYTYKVLTLIVVLRRFIRSFYRDHHRDEIKNEFSPEYQCRNTLLKNLRSLCFEAVYNITFMERIIKVFSPDIICVLPDMYFLQQLAVVLAKRQGIPTLTCSAAWDFDHPRSLLRRFHVDKIATMGEKVKKAYIAAGIKPDKVVIAGVAHFDRMLNRDKEKDKLVLMNNGINPEKEIVVFATQHSIKEMVEMVGAVITAILKLQDVQLVIKVHPLEDIDVYNNITEKFHESRLHVVKSIDLYSLMNNCQLFITGFSTTALEAMMMDKPVITINLSGKSVTVPYAEEGASFGVFKMEDIEPAIMEVLKNEETRRRLKVNRDRFVREWAGEPDGRASQRIVDLMKEMIESSGKYKN